MTLPTRRIVVLRANRETLLLIACTIGVTLAIASTHRQHPTPEQPVRQVWAGQLADVAPPAASSAQPEPMTSESLVVPKAALAMPAAQPVVRPAAKATCDGQPCPAKAAAPVPPARQRVATADLAASAKPAVEPARAVEKKRDRRFELSDLNPLHHLPDAVRKPFSYAGAKVSGWIDWF